MNGDGQVEFPLVTRVEIIDSTGRAFTEYLNHPGASIQMQDGGRTMKLFVDGPADGVEVVRAMKEFFPPEPVDDNLGSEH